MDIKSVISSEGLKEPPSWWYDGRIPTAAWGLLPVSAAYGAIVKKRFRSAAPYRSKLPVICVGNLTMGGAGKTPVALKLASLLSEAGRKPGFLTRGYGGNEQGPYKVDAAASGADRVGDEPLLLARAAATVVSHDRPSGAMLLEALGVDTIIMDDGFQNPSIEKDFSLIVVDAGAGLGSARVFPLGPLRAPLDFQLARADAVLILGRGGRRAEVVALIEQERRRPLPIFGAGIVPLVPDGLRDRQFLAFCGIGRPGKFFDTLKEAGISAVKSRSFPDHHPYTEDDARSLMADAKALNVGLITTEKDRVRLQGKGGALADLYQSAAALPITIEFWGDAEERIMLALSNGPRALVMPKRP